MVSCYQVGFDFFGFKINYKVAQRTKAEKLLKTFRWLDGYINFVEQK